MTLTATITIDPEFASLLVPLTDDEAAQLEASIATEGIREPLVAWDGLLLDGHNRYRIAQARSIRYEVREAQNVTDRETARNWIIANQLGRRNLTPEAASALRGARYNREKLPTGRPRKESQNATISGPTDKRLADEYHVDPATIHRDGAFAANLETLEEVAGPEVRKAVLTRDAKLTRSDVSRLANAAKKEPERVREVVRRVMDGKAKDPKAAIATVREEEVQAKAVDVKLPDLLDLRQGDFAEVCIDIPDGSVSLVYTDPPYGAEYLDCWVKLGEVAKRVLTPGGLLLALSGKLHLPTCLSALMGSLDYYWMASVGYEDAKKSIHGVRFWGQWRPILIFSNGPHEDHRFANDLLYLAKDARPDQTLHPWAQADAPAAYYIERLTEPGDTVLDPMCGTGSFARAAAAIGRKAIGVEKDPERYKVCLGLCAEVGDE